MYVNATLVFQAVVKLKKSADYSNIIINANGLETTVSREQVDNIHVSNPSVLIGCISRNYSRSSQCSMTGVTKAVVCVILSVG